MLLAEKKLAVSAAAAILAVALSQANAQGYGARYYTGKPAFHTSYSAGSAPVVLPPVTSHYAVRPAYINPGPVYSGYGYTSHYQYGHHGHCGNYAPVIYAPLVPVHGSYRSAWAGVWTSPSLFLNYRSRDLNIRLRY